MYSVITLQHPEGFQLLVGDRTVRLEVYESDVDDDGNTPTRPPFAPRPVPPVSRPHTGFIHRAFAHPVVVQSSPSWAAPAGEAPVE